MASNLSVNMGDEEDPDDLGIPGATALPEIKAKFVTGALKRAADYRAKADQATEALRSYRAPSTTASTLLAIGSSLLSPTRGGSFGETLGNVGSTVGALTYQRDKDDRAAKRAEADILIKRYEREAGREEGLATTATKQGQIMELAKGLFPNDPVKQAAFTGAPEKYLAAMADNEKAYNLGQGEGRFVGGNRVGYNNKTGFEGDVPYSIGSDGAPVYGAARPTTHAEVETARHNAAEEGIAGGNLGVAQGNLGMRGKELGFQQAGGIQGALAPPPAAASIDPLPALEAALRKRGLLK